jgi:hypothetical protein
LVPVLTGTGKQAAAFVPALLLVLAGAPAGAVEVDVGGEVRFNLGSFRPWTFYDAREDDSEFLLQRTRVAIDAELVDEVKGVVELQAFGDFGRNEANLGIWWPDRRDDHIADEDIWLYQGYLEARKLLGSPFSITLGKQELVYGGEFLLGNNDAGDMFFGHSFDAFKTRAESQELMVDLFLARLIDNRFLLDIGELSRSHHRIEDADATLYGAYGVWTPETGVTNHRWLAALDGYLLSIQIADYNEILAGELSGLGPGVPLPASFPGHGNMDGRHAWLGGWGGWFPAGTWDAGPSGWWQRRNTKALGPGAAVLGGADTLAADASLSTAGFRAGGSLGAWFDYNLEYARQFGHTGRPDFTDSTISSGKYTGWAANLELAHEFEGLPGKPRLSGGYVHLSGGAGENARGPSGERIPGNDVETFQRLWSDQQYGENLDRAPFGVFLSNVKIIQAGLALDVTLRGSFTCNVYHYTVDDRLDPNGPIFGANPEATDLLSPLDTPGDRAAKPDENLGSEIDVSGTYHITEGLRSTLGYALFLNGDTLEDQVPGEFEADENQHYVFLDVKLTF